MLCKELRYSWKPLGGVVKLVGFLLFLDGKILA